MFRITDDAAKQIKIATEQSDAAGMILRIAAKTNQDGSIEYGMGFDEARENDVHISHDDVEVVIDATSNELLEEASIDYVELEPGQFNFIFINPLDPNYEPPPKKKG
jgi:iron-sulfur cluster assembly protein